MVSFSQFACLPAVAALLAATPGMAGTLDEPNQSSETITVTADRNVLVAVEAGTGALGNRSIFETPFSVTSLTEDLIASRQLVSIIDLTRFDASTHSVQARGAYFDTIRIRGFPTTQVFEGFVGPFSRGGAFDVEPYERVEFLKGAAGMLVGVTGFFPGGAINLVPKRAGTEPQVVLTARSLGGQAFIGHVDAGRRFGSDDRFGARVNLVRQQGETNVRGLAPERTLAQAALDVGKGPVRVFVDLQFRDYTSAGAHPGLIVAAGLAVPAAPRLDRTTGQPWTDYRVQRRFGVVRAEYDFASEWLVGLSWANTFTDERGRYDGDGTILNAAGDISVTTGKGDGRHVWSDDWTGYVRGRFDTGPISHAINIVASTGFEKYRFRVFRPFAFRSNIYNPVVVPDPGNDPLQPPGAGGLLDRTRDGLFASNDLSALDGKVSVLLGGRYTRVTQFRATGTGEVTQDVTSRRVLPIGALTVRPVGNLHLYASYVENLEFGAVAPNNAVNARSVTPPLASRQVEVGAKLDLRGLAVTGAWFRIAKENAFLDPVTLVFAANGEQVHRGFELSVFGEPIAGTRLIGGAMLLDATLTRTAGGQFDGNAPTGVPRLRLVSTIEQDVKPLAGLLLFANANHTSRMFLDPRNSQRVPAFTLFDLGATWRFAAGGMPIDVRATIENVADRRYWAGSNGGALTFGMPRTLLLGLSVGL